MMTMNMNNAIMLLLQQQQQEINPRSVVVQYQPFPLPFPQMVEQPWPVRMVIIRSKYPAVVRDDYYKSWRDIPGHPGRSSIIRPFHKLSHRDVWAIKYASGIGRAIPACIWYDWNMPLSVYPFIRRETSWQSPMEHDYIFGVSP